MLNTENAKPDIEEQYETASNGSNILTAAGMVQIVKDGEAPPVYSAVRTGMAFLRLHGEWDGAAKPKRLDKNAVAVLASIIKAEDAKDKAQAQRKGAPYKSPGSAATRAADQAQAWYAGELRILAQTLKSRPVVWEQMSKWAAVKGIPSQTVAEALAYWLNPICPVCDGHGFRKVEGQPALSARQCLKCDSGKARRPNGTGPVLNWIDDCLMQARKSLKYRLHKGE